MIENFVFGCLLVALFFIAMAVITQIVVALGAAVRILFAPVLALWRVIPASRHPLCRAIAAARAARLARP